MDAQVLGILVPPFGNMEPQVASRPQHAVELPRPGMYLQDPVEGKDAVLVGVGYEERSGGHQAGNHGVVPAG